ncbi:MAG: hypothetical protein ACR2IV_21665 [Bryobacteraceae bacterium]
MWRSCFRYTAVTKAGPSVPGLWKWWTGNPGALLSTVTLVPVALLFALLVLFLILLVALNTSVVKRLV